MIIRNNLSGFYDKSEVAFLGQEINYKFMTLKELDKSLADSIALFNELFPPKKSFFTKALTVAGTLVAIVGTAGEIYFAFCCKATAVLKQANAVNLPFVSPECAKNTAPLTRDDDSIFQVRSRAYGIGAIFDVRACGDHRQ